MYGYIYLITNTITNKKYIGKHASSTFDDSYYGSGVLLVSEMKKYPKGVYDREVLDWANSRETLNELEKYYIQKYNAVESDEFLNLSCGGDGGDVISLMDPHKYADRSSKISRALMGHSISEETRRKISEGQKAAWNNPDSELRLKRKQIDVEKWRDPAVREAHADGLTNYWKDHREERHLQLSNLIHRSWASTEFREKQHLSRSTDAYRELMTRKLKGKTKGYIVIHKGDSQKRIPPDTLDNFLLDGWVRGRKPFSNITKSKMSKSATGKKNASKPVFCVDLSETFDSVKDCSEKLNLSEYRIRKSIMSGESVDGHLLIWKEGD